MNRSVWLSLFLIIAASLSTVLMLRNTGHRQLPPPPQTLKQRPNAFMINANYNEYDERGHLHSHLFTPKTIHYSNKNSATFKQPSFMIYTDKHIPWYIAADHGRSQDGIQTVYLWDNVDIHQPAEPDNPETTITTSAATVYPDRSMATTNRHVTIVRPGSFIKAKGMQANFKTGVVKLDSHSQGIYDSETAKTAISQPLNHKKGQHDADAKRKKSKENL